MARLKNRQNRVGLNTVNGVFSNESHDYYAIYDDLADELIIRFVEPGVIALNQPMETDDNIDWLIDPERNEMVGFNIHNFQSIVLKNPELIDFREVWYRENLSNCLEQYRKFHYNPKEHIKPQDTTKKDTFSWTNKLRRSERVLQEDLVTC